MVALSIPSLTHHLPKEHFIPLLDYGKFNQFVGMHNTYMEQRETLKKIVQRFLESRISCSVKKPPKQPCIIYSTIYFWLDWVMVYLKVVCGLFGRIFFVENDDRCPRSP